jgi:hypothetical protein
MPQLRKQFPSAYECVGPARRTVVDFARQWFSGEDLGDIEYAVGEAPSRSTRPGAVRPKRDRFRTRGTTRWRLRLCFDGELGVEKCATIFRRRASLELFLGINSLLYGFSQIVDCFDFVGFFCIVHPRSREAAVARKALG